MMFAPGMLLLRALILSGTIVNVLPLSMEESLSHHIVSMDPDVLRTEGKDMADVREELAALPGVVVHDVIEIGRAFRAVVISDPENAREQVQIFSRLPVCNIHVISRELRTYPLLKVNCMFTTYKCISLAD